MDLQESLVKNLVMKIKQEIFSLSDVDLCFLVNPPCAYHTAWLATIPNPQLSDRPLFEGCLNWVLRNQNRGGFWGETETAAGGDHVPTIHCLTSTLACIVALSTWNVGHAAIQKGLAFIHANTEELLLKEQQKQMNINGSLFPEWFVIVFPAMVELAQNKGLHVCFSNGSTPLIKQVFLERYQIFSRWVLPCQHQYHPRLMPCLEALPETYNEVLLRQTEDLLDGLIQLSSPAAMAYAFMKTGNKEFLAYLNYIVQTCGHGVTAVHPLDEDLLKICVIDRIERLGLAEHFIEEIKTILPRVYRSYMSCEEPKSMAKHVLPLQLYRDSLAFRLLRLHGYIVSPRKLCRFLEDEDMTVYIEAHPKIFVSAMYNVYRATDVMFTGESQLEDARAFSRRILEKEVTKDSKINLVLPLTNLQDQIKHEISRSWLARLDHLEHRRCLESKETIGPWTGKPCSYRLSCPSNALLLQLAIENFTLRQSIFRSELKELEKWTKGMGLSDMGFAREKTTYCYFAVASTLSLPSLSNIRLVVAKSAILVTVADDFFDKGASLNELEALTNAVKRWQQKGLNGHGKTIFNALKDLLDDISLQFFNKNGYDIQSYLQDLWYQTFVKWLKEAEWSRNGHTPSVVEYLQVATGSSAAQTIVLTAALLLSPPPPIHILECPQNEPVTNLLMVLTRLLNEIQTYQKEQEEGKQNLVVLQMKENPNLGVEESIGVIQKILEEKNKGFLEHVLVNNGMSDMSEECKLLHLYCLKTFQMFYNSTNAFDSPTELLADINRAIYDPLEVVDIQGSNSTPLNSLQTFGLNKNKSAFPSYGGQVGKSLKQSGGTSSFKPCNGTSMTSGVIKAQGKEFVTKPYVRVISLKMRKPTIHTTYPKPKAYIC